MFTMTGIKKRVKVLYINTKYLYYAQKSVIWGLKVIIFEFFSESAIGFF